MKKLISVMLASVMAMALMIPAFATTSSQTMTAAGTTAAPTIKLTMPKAVNIALNPYRMSYKNEKIGIATATNETFISPIVEIKNESNVALTMSVKGNATKAGGIKILTALPTGAETLTTSDPGDKNVMISVNILPNVADALVTTGTDADDLLAALTGDDLATAVLSDKAADLKFGEADDAPTTIDLDAAITVGDDGAVTATPNYIRLNFSGDCNTNPKDAYVAADTVGASLTFTFKPVAAAVADADAEENP
jgi:hypothetical protein